jgi:hypothetical protein
LVAGGFYLVTTVFQAGMLGDVFFGVLGGIGGYIHDAGAVEVGSVAMAVAGQVVVDSYGATFFTHFTASLSFLLGVPRG